MHSLFQTLIRYIFFVRAPLSERLEQANYSVFMLIFCLPFPTFFGNEEC